MEGKIGLEIHGYLDTSEKLFCRCKAVHGIKFTEPNKNICPVCTGQPGAKPMLPNKTALDKVIQISLILGCKINQKLTWQRKHYDWPDLPKGYQNTISGPYAIPVAEKGKFNGIRITEAHLEEDPAAWNPKTGEIDYNKSGSPLIEIVTEPDFKNSDEVVEWLRQLLATLKYIKAIDKNAGIKADVNVSINHGERVEMKNINSISNIKMAIDYEIKRQQKENPKSQETRMFDESKGATVMMRTKEQAADYRFISDPDLPIVKIEKQRVEKIKESLPETPKEKLNKIVKKHKIEKKHAETLTKNLDLVEFFEKVVEKSNPVLASQWITHELKRILNYSKKELDEVNINPEHFTELLELIENKTLTELKAKEMLNKFIPESFSPKKEAEKHTKISDKEIKEITDNVIKENPKAVEDYKAGKQESLNFLLGQVMRYSQKRADSKTAREILIDKLR